MQFNEYTRNFGDLCDSSFSAVFKSLLGYSEIQFAISWDEGFTVFQLINGVLNFKKHTVTYKLIL